MDWESQLTFLCLAVSLAILATARRQAGIARSFKLIFAVIAPAFILAAFICGKQAAARAKIAAPPATVPLEVSGEGYISSQSCKSCHPNQYASWHGSYHRSMTQAPTPDAIKGRFDGIELDIKGNSYRPFRRGDEFWMEVDAAPRKIELLTGSHHIQVYWFASGVTRMLDHAPIVYAIGEDRWIPRDSSFLSPPAEGEPETPAAGEWNQSCIRCHTTHSQPQMNSPKEMYSQAAEFGISCEACHRPGEEHARLNRNPIERYRFHLADAPDETIVNPRRLSDERSSQVCAQCHGLWVDTLHAMREWVVHGEQFRPGDDLNILREYIRPNDEKQREILNEIVPDFQQAWFWPDGVIRVTGNEFTGLIESPCYKDAPEGRRMTCLSCHAMHPSGEAANDLSHWADDQLKPGMRGDRGCLQCHAKLGDNLPAHTHHAAESSGSRCYNCHLPHTTYGLLTAIRSHQIQTPDARESVASGRPNGCNQCHLDKTLEWTGNHLHEWYGTPKPELTEEQITTAASVLWILKGDAVQRALAAWTYGWEPAREVSGHQWMTMFLGQLLVDPYDAVRLMAYKSIRLSADHNLGRPFIYDFIADKSRREAARERIFEAWKTQRASRLPPVLPQLTDEERELAKYDSQLVFIPPPLTSAETNSHVLLNAQGFLDQERFDRLLKERDDTPIILRE